MSVIPLDLFQFEQVKYLDLPDLLHLCQVNRQFYSICQNPETWRYLLFRDFHLKYDGPDVKEIYMDAFERVKDFSLHISKVENFAEKRNLNIAMLDSILSEMGFRLVNDKYLPMNINKDNILEQISIYPEEDVQTSVFAGTLDIDFAYKIRFGQFYSHWPSREEIKQYWTLEKQYGSAILSLLPGFELDGKYFWMDPYDAVVIYNFYHPGKDIREEFKRVVEKAYTAKGGYLSVHVSEEQRDKLLKFVDTMVPF